MRVTGCRIMVRVTGCRIMVEELKSSTTTTPAATLSRCRRVPCIVNVLPVPVCPYAKTQAQSSTTLTRRRLKEALANAVTQQEDAKPKHVGQRGAVREHAEQEAADHEFVGRRGVERLRVDHGANGGKQWVGFCHFLVAAASRGGLGGIYCNFAGAPNILGRLYTMLTSHCQARAPRNDCSRAHELGRAELPCKHWYYLRPDSQTKWRCRTTEHNYGDGPDTCGAKGKHHRRKKCNLTEVQEGAVERAETAARDEADKLVTAYATADADLSTEDDQIWGTSFQPRRRGGDVGSGRVG